MPEWKVPLAEVHFGPEEIEADVAALVRDLIERGLLESAP